MPQKNFNEVLDLVLEEDPRYQRGAYFFLRQALDYTIKANKLDTRAKRESHISGQELLKGIRDYALDQYGPMAKTVFDEWGVQSCSDFGEIVFNLVDKGILGKTEEDSRKDFITGYDFDDAFVKPFQPTATQK